MLGCALLALAVAGILLPIILGTPLHLGTVVVLGS
jgi:hypothetical protein